MNLYSIVVIVIARRRVLGWREGGGVGGVVRGAGGGECEGLRRLCGVGGGWGACGARNTQEEEGGRREGGESTGVAVSMKKIKRI